MTLHRTIIVFFLALLLSIPGLAQSDINGNNGHGETMPNVNERPSVQAISIEINPTIDGEVINDEVWQNISPIVDLWQTRPHANRLLG